MANSQRGEFTLALGGTSYTLKLGTAALVAFQEAFATDKGAPSIPELITEVHRGRLRYVRALLWAGLRKHHPEVTLEAVDDLIDQAEPAEVGQLLAHLGASAQPARADLEALGIQPDGNGNGTGRPPTAQETGRQASKRKARTSTGAPSISPDVAPV